MLIIKTLLFESTQGRWLYALLACLEKPLLPEAHSLIRQLARRCSEVRVLEVRFNVTLLNLANYQEDDFLVLEVLVSNFSCPKFA